MRQAAIAAALFAAMTHQAAQAATYIAALAGNGINQTETDNIPISWTGQVTVVTDGSGDGTYTGDTLQSITVVTDVFGDVFDWNYTQGQIQVAWEYWPGEFALVGPEPGASVTVADGRLAGVDLVYDDYFTIDTMSGPNVSAQTSCRTVGLCHGAPDNYIVSGTLTPLAGPVPEPATPLLLLAGLGLAGVRARRTRA